MKSSHAALFDLSPAEKLQLIEDLWEDLTKTPEALPLRDWQQEELARREANLMNNPASTLTWDQIKERVRSRHDR